MNQIVENLESHVVNNHVVQNDVVKSQLSHASTCQQVLEYNRTLLRSALFDLGVTEVSIEYSGGGDSGEVTEVSCQPESLLSSLKSQQIEVQDACRSFDGTAYVSQLKSDSSTLQDALEAFAMLWLEIEHAGWEINDGGSGKVTIDVMADHFTLNHSEYYQESTEYEYELE